MIKFDKLKWVCYDFDDTLCIHQYHLDCPPAEYLASLLARGTRIWDNALKSSHMKKFMDFCADNGIQQALITASPEHLSAEMKNLWVQEQYGHALRNYAMGTGDSKVEMLKAIAKSEGIEPSTILIVDDRWATLNLAILAGFQACTPMEVVHFVECNMCIKLSPVETDCGDREQHLSNVAKTDHTDSGYPNLMCFGRDISNCPIVQSCSDYQACQAKYDDDWLSLFS